MTLPSYLVALAAFAFALFGFLVARLAIRLRRAEADAARHFRLARDPICLTDLDGRIKGVNPAFERALGYSEEESLDRLLADFVDHDDRNRWLDRQGEAHWLDWTSTTFPDENVIYAVAREVTERKALEQELERLSQRDPLTGLLNRRRFDEELGLRLSDARRHDRGGALLLIDLDRFKAINDALGHAAGDLALCEVARVLDENTRGGDEVGRHVNGLVARVGGDEFAVLLGDVGPVEAAAIGERLVEALEATDLHFDGSSVPLAASVGIARFDGGTTVRPQELLTLADRAMYVVKAGGGAGTGEAEPAGSAAGR